ncbi:MAG TPA: hypothetical protein VFQ85_13220 [Mycobacteriales bacterium]|jgi:hypothetical protein|nr:hypothetical protein [Mycobacteriales bacterium]
MARRLVLGLAAVAAVGALGAPAHAIGCPPGTYHQWIGLYNPTTGEKLEPCLPYIPPPS